MPFSRNKMGDFKINDHRLEYIQLRLDEVTGRPKLDDKKKDDGYQTEKSHRRFLKPFWDLEGCEGCDDGGWDNVFWFWEVFGTDVSIFPPKHKEGNKPSCITEERLQNFW
uniref:Uncharacterized protein n=1 Tax=Paramoeba aestuarina TaxID=180227 RepID=A0A7S4KJC4_9EUKA|mmetsp:Transcript_20209/g.31621  ORF Transcript_20209/g.31621 Transcript_20209/m.31621 type:complete len:110 (+) Transcript_20209:162-491(+)